MTNKNSPRQQPDSSDPASYPTATALPSALNIVMHVYGCQMNKADAESVAGTLDAAFDGNVAFDVPESDADGILFITCSVRAQAENRVWANLGRLRELKRRRPALIIGVLGCMAQKDAAAIRRRAPHVDLIVGTRELDRIPEFIEALRNGAPPIVRTGESDGFDFAGVTPRLTMPFRAWMPITRGCNKRCTYCVVPTTRGPEVSRPMDDLVREAETLAARGVRELNLLGQTIDTYGDDLGDPAQNLAALLRKLHEIDDLWRINFVTSYPAKMSEAVFDAVADCERVSRYVHMPIQSGSNAQLKLMKRGYTRERYMDLVAVARERVPDIEIATDVIVGFCNESDADFRQTVDVFEQVKFQNAFIFRYSPRDGTPAARMDDNVPDAVKRERQQVLLALQESISRAAQSRYIGRTVRVLVEGVSKRDATRLTGRTNTNRIVVFPIRGNEDLTGRMVDVKILSSTPLTLFGEASGSDAGM